MTQILRQSTEVIVIIGPFVDVSDGFTPETGVTLSGADEAELLKANTATTTSIAAATWAAVTGCDGYYALTLTTSLTDTVGPLTVMVNDDSVCLPVIARFQVVEEAAYDAIYAASAAPATAAGVSAVETDTQDIQTQIGTAGAGLTDLGGMSTTMKEQVNTEADTALTDYDPPTNTEMVAAFTEIKGATWATTDTLEAIRDRGDAAWITATGFSTHSAADVWSVATRVLTAGTNIALAKGTGVTGFNDLDAAGVRSAVGLASANLDTQIAAVKSQTGDIETDTQDLQTQIGTAGAGLTDLGGMSTAMKAEVNAEADTAISDAALATAASLATVDMVVDAVKAKTDSLIFTVAGKVDANVTYVNGIEVTGAGTTVDPWGPV